MNGGELVVAFALSAVMCGLWGLYIADRCRLGWWECLLHGVFLGPLGLIVLLLYPRKESTDSQRLAAMFELLAAIRLELEWQRQQKEKEIQRAKVSESANH